MMAKFRIKAFILNFIFIISIINACTSSVGDSSDNGSISSSSNPDVVNYNWVSESPQVPIESLYGVDANGPADTHILYKLEDGSIFSKYNPDQTSFYSPMNLKNIKQLNLKTVGSFVQIGEGCAIDLNSDLYCWGNNEYGDVGNGTYLSTQIGEAVIDYLRYPTFEVFKVMGNVQSIYRRNVRAFLRPSTMCAITTDKELYCWGENPGDLYQVNFGDNILKSHTPILIKNDVIGFNELNTYYFEYDSFISEKDNLSTSCFLFNQRFGCINEDNVQKAIQTESSGTFFIDSNSNLATFQNGKSIISYEKYQDIALAGENTICVIDFSGNVFCMLSNSAQGNIFGQGNEHIAYSDELIKIPNISKALSFPEVNILGGDLCLLTIEKQVLCWGDDFDGVYKIQP